MTALAHARPMDQIVAGAPSVSQAGVDGGSCLYEGGFVAPLTATGYLTNGGGVASTNAVCGIAASTYDNTSGTDGVGVDGVSAAAVTLLHGVFARTNSTGAALTNAHLYKPCYAEDDQTVRNAGGATYPLAGIVWGFEDDGRVQVLCHGGLNYLLSQSALSANLAAITAGLGASLIGVQDADAHFPVAADVEACLKDIFVQLAKATTPGGASLVGLFDTANHWTSTTLETLAAEIAVHLKTAQASIVLRPMDFALATGAPMAIWANGATTVPGFYIDNAKAQVIRWNNDAAPAQVMTSFQIPADMNLAVAPTLVIHAHKIGATLGDAVTFAVSLYNQVVGALQDADVDWGGTTTAMTGDATTKTVQEVTLAGLSAGDLPMAGSSVTMLIKPTAGTLGTDDLSIDSVAIKYTRKILTS